MRCLGWWSERNRDQSSQKKNGVFWAHDLYPTTFKVYENSEPQVLQGAKYTQQYTCYVDNKWVPIACNHEGCHWVQLGRHLLIPRYAPIYKVFRHGQLGKSPMVAPTVSTTVTKMRSNCIKELKLQPVTKSGKREQNAQSVGLRGTKNKVKDNFHRDIYLDSG